MDKRLLILERYLEKYGQDFTQLSDELNVSSRQLSRILRKWDEEGYIKYIPGHGRGVKTKIKLNMDIARELFNEMNKYRDELSIEEFNRYLELPWPVEYIESIRKIIEYERGQDPAASNSTAMMDYLYKVPETFIPSLSIEHASTLVGLQVFETLYRSDVNKEIKVHLLRYDEWRGDDEPVFHMCPVLSMLVFIYMNQIFCDGAFLEPATESGVADQMQVLVGTGNELAVQEHVDIQ